MTLSDSNEAQPSADKNTALVGQKFVQFGIAKPRGNKRYELSGLQKGLGGIERYIPGHTIGENFIVFEQASATLIVSHHFTLFQASHFLALRRDGEQPVVAEID